MKRRLFFKALAGMGLSGLALKLSFADAGMRRLTPDSIQEVLGPSVQIRDRGQIVETLTSALNDCFYSMIHRPTGIRVNVHTVRRVERLADVSQDLRKQCLTRIYGELRRRELAT